MLSLILAQEEALQVTYYLILWNLVKKVWFDLNNVCVLGH